MDKSLHRRPFASIVLLFFSICLSGAVTPDVRDLRVPAVPHGQIANGLTVVLEPHHEAPVVSLQLRYDVGSRDDPPDQPGLATLVAHMMQRASAHVPDGDYERLLEQAGATHSMSIHNDSTVFSASVPANAVPLLLWLWSDQMGFFAPRVDQRQIEQERALVRSQRRTSVENAAYGEVRELIRKALYPPDHPYYAIPLANGLDRIGVEDVRAFFDQHYVPNRAVLAISGDFEPQRLLEEVKRWFGPIPPGPSDQWRVPPVSLAREQRLEIAANVSAPAVVMTWPTPALYAPGDAELDMVASLLGGREIRLLERYFLHSRAITSAAARQTSWALSSQFEIWVEVARGHEPEEVIRGIDEVVGALRRNGVPEGALARALLDYIAPKIFALERPEERVRKYADYTALLKDPNSLISDFERYRKLTPEKVRAAVERWLPLERRVVAVVRPDPAAPPCGVLRSGGGQPAQAAAAAEPTAPAPVAPVRVTPDAPFRSKPPPIDAAPRFPMPQLQSFHLHNGLRVVLLERHVPSLLRLQLVVRTRSPVPPGALQMLVLALSLGTEKKTLPELNAAIDGAFAQYAAWASSGVAHVTLTTFGRNAATVIPLLSEIALQPRFDEKLYELNRERWAAMRDRRDEVPAAVALRVLPMSLFGWRDPPGLPDALRGSDLRVVAREEVLRLYKSTFNPGAATLVVVGDATQQSLLPMLEESFGGWQSTAAKVAAPVAASEVMTSSPRIVVVDRPHAPNSLLLLGGLGPGRGSPAAPAMMLLSSLLGGGGLGLIQHALRDELQLTSSGRSSLVTVPDGALLTLQAEVAVGRTAEALRELEKLLQRLREAPLDPAEVRRHAQRLVLAGPMALTSIDGASSLAASIPMFDLPANDAATLAGRINSVTPAELKQLARRSLDLARMKIVVVGDWTALRPQLLGLGLGPVELRDASGAVLRVEPEHP